MIAVLDYGIGNLRSAQKALQRVGAQARLTSDPGEVESASGIVLPGVGSFGRCLEALRASGLDRPAMAAIDMGKPFLGICVGMQMLYEGSDEDQSAKGLAVLPGQVRRLPIGQKHPQMQWNRLLAKTPTGALMAGLGEDPWAYFVHSFAAPIHDGVVATTDYGGPVNAAIEIGPLWATQFHPEKSGGTGLAILANFAGACDKF